MQIFSAQRAAEMPARAERDEEDVPVAGPSNPKSAPAPKAGTLRFVFTGLISLLLPGKACDRCRIVSALLGFRVPADPLSHSARSITLLVHLCRACIYPAAV